MRRNYSFYVTSLVGLLLLLACLARSFVLSSLSRISASSDTYGTVMLVVNRRHAPICRENEAEAPSSTPTRDILRQFRRIQRASTAVGRLYEELNIVTGSNTSNHTSGAVSITTALEAATVRALVRTVLRCCAREQNLELALDVLGHLKEGHVQDRHGATLLPTQDDYLPVISACRAASQAIALIREMRLTRRYRYHQIPPTRLHYTQALKVCRQTQDLDAARFLLDHARNDALHPDIFMYTTALWTCAEAREASEARRVWEDLLEDGCEPTLVTYNGLLAAQASCWDVSGAMDTFHLLQEQYTPNRVTYRYLASVLKLVDDLGVKLYLLGEIYATLGDLSIKTAVPILEALIFTHGVARNYESARRVFDSIRGPSDALTQRAILFACSNSIPPRWEEALDLLHTSDILEDQRGGMVDPLALSYAVVACAKANEWEEGLGLLRLYGNNRTTMHAVNSVIASCGRSGRPDMAMEVLNEMERFDLQPDAFSYRNAIIACNQAEHELRRTGRRDEDSLFSWWECSLSLLRRCKEDSIRPDVQTYSSAISACEAAGEWQRALSILSDVMNDESIQPNVFCFNSALAACARGGAWVEALDLFERMKDGGPALRPNQITIGSLIQALDGAGQKELAQSVYEGALELKMVTNPWRMTYGGTNQRIRAMDLHRFSSAMARTAIRSHMEALVLSNSDEGALDDLAGDFIVITGKGLCSIDSKPILNPAVRHFLESEYGLTAVVDPKNAGRIVVSADDLRAFLEAQNWSDDVDDLE